MSLRIKFFFCNFFSFKKENLYFYLLAILIIAAFFIPFFNKSGELLFDDAAYEFFPRQIALARSIQNFEIPLWDSNRFLGGCPFYTDYETGSYSFLLYPFWYVADLTNLENSYFYLYKFPFFVFTFIAWCSFYTLLKSGMKISGIGAFAGALVWALGPHMLTDAFLYTSDLLVFAFFPMALFGIKRCFDKRNFKSYFYAGLFQALMVSGGDFNYILRCYLFIFLFLLFLFIKGNLSTFYKKKSFYISFIAIFCLPFCISFILILPFWSGIGEGILWMFSHNQKAMDLSQNFEYRVSLTYIVNIFFPEFFGLARGDRIWGDGWFQFHEFGLSGILAGGSIFLFLLFNFIFNKKDGILYKKIQSKKLSYLCNNCAENKNNEFLGYLNSCFGMGVYFQVLTVFLILLVYTPAYSFLNSIIPFVFSLPYPVYYRFGQCLGMAFCLGSAVSFFGKENAIKRKSLICFLLFTLVFIIIVLSFKSDFYNNLNFYRNYEFRTNLYFLHNIKGLAVVFIKSNFLWIFLFLFILIISRNIGTNFFKKIKFFLISLMILEFLFYSYFVFYKNSDMLPEYKSYSSTKFDKVYKKRYRGPLEHPLYKRAGLCKSIMTSGFKRAKYGQRFLSFLSFTDNYSWIFNEYAVFGNDSKPINPKIFKLLDSFATGFPYQLTLEKINFLLFSNLGVISFISQNGLIDSSSIDEINPNEIDTYEKSNLNLENSILDGGLKQYNIPYKPLSFFSFNRNIKVLEKETQFERIFDSNLKEVAFIEALNADLISGDIMKVSNSIEKNKILGKITYLKARPNSFDIKAYTTNKSLLIINQCWHRGWHALINKTETPIYNVNWYMQALKLNKGCNEVKMYFFPETIHISLKISIVFFLICSFYLKFKKEN